MSWRPAGPTPPVEVHEAAIRAAQAFLEEHYTGPEKKNMEGWLRRFLVEVHEDPFRVLGYPPMTAASDKTLLVYPLQKDAPIGAEAYVQLPDTRIHVHTIQPRPPKTLLKGRAREDAVAVKKASEAAATKPAFDRTARAKLLREHEAKRRRKS